MYGWSKHGYSGLGFTVDDLMAESGREECVTWVAGFPSIDDACVGRNQQRATAVNDLWMSTYMKDPNTANLTAPSITIGVDRSQRALDAFHANNPVTDESISVGTGPAYTVAQLERATSPVVTSSPVVATPPKSSTPVTPQVNPQGQVIVNSSGPNASTPGAPASDASAGFSLAAVPWWGWLGAAGVAVFALRGAR